MKLLLLLVASLSVFGAFIVQVVAITNGPFNRAALLVRLGLFVVWLTSLVLVNGELLGFAICTVDCIWGMTRQGALLELAVIAVNALVAWFAIRGVPLVARSRSSAA
jgi:hypothetical protein